MEASWTLLRRLCTYNGLNVTLEAEGGLTAWFTARNLTKGEAA